MLKKMVILGVIGFVAVSALGGTKFYSYMRSEWKAAQERAEASIPPEKELRRLREEIKLLDKDILAVVDEVAKQRVAVKQLEAQTEKLSAEQATFLKNLKDRGTELKARDEALRGAQGHVTFGDRTFNIAEATKNLEAAKAELEADAKRYKKNQQSLETMQTTLVNRIKVRDSLEKQLAAMKIQKIELTATADELEAQLAALKVQQTESKFQTDESRMAKIKEDLRNLRTKVDVEKEKLSLMPAAHDAATPTTPTGGKSVDDILSGLEPTKPVDTKMPKAD